LPLAVAVLGGLTAFLTLRWALKDAQKAGLLLSLFGFLFFTYGHVSGILAGHLKGFRIGRAAFGPDAVLYAVWAGLFVGGVWRIWRRRTLNEPTKVLNMLAATLLVLPLLNITAFVARSRPWSTLEKGEPRVAAPLAALGVNAAVFPHIYYVILDGYGRQDILQEIYDYDNTEFIGYLAARGFYVAPRSTSNYCQTVLSVGSSLNLEYLPTLLRDHGYEPASRKPLIQRLRRSRVREVLSARGYRFAAFSSVYSPMNIPDADSFLKADSPLDEFQSVILNSTPIPPLIRKLSSYPALLRVLTKLETFDSHAAHRRQLLHVFEHLERLAVSETPVFVFAHIMAPHPPFVFGAAGERVDPPRKFSSFDGSHFMELPGASREEYVNGYRRQIAFVNRKLKETVDGILRISSRPTVIILQADHGPGSRLDWSSAENSDLRERMAILNAYYLPEGARTLFYDSITPVNTFRLLFNRYFRTSYEKLEDENYFSATTTPYQFIRVTDRVR
jgi:hypothetical protein